MFSFEYLERPGRFWHKHELDHYLQQIHQFLAEDLKHSNVDQIFPGTRLDLRQKLIILARNGQGKIVGMLSLTEKRNLKKEVTLSSDLFFCQANARPNLTHKLYYKILWNYFLKNGPFKTITTELILGHEKIQLNLWSLLKMQISHPHSKMANIQHQTQYLAPLISLENKPLSWN